MTLKTPNKATRENATLEDRHDQDLETVKARNHPLWSKQVELERGMMREGADQFRSRVVKITERKQMSRLDAIRGLIDSYLPEVATTITDWTKGWSSTARYMGPGSTVPVALEPLRTLNPYASALIALRACFDGFTVGKVNLTGLACEIGRTVEHELQVQLWEAKEPALFYAQQKELDANNATATHVRRVNINRFNALMDAGLFGFQWDRWADVKHFKVGVELINAIVRATGWFRFELDLAVPYRPPYILVPSEFMLEWFAAQIDHKELTSPAFAPTIIPPRRWEGTRRGGYHTPYVRTPRLIRFKASQVTQRDRAADEYEALDMPEVYATVNYLQEVSWRINKKVYEVARTVISKDMGIAGIDKSGHEELPPKPPGFLHGDVEGGLKVDRWANVDPEAAKQWRKEASQVYAKNAKCASTSLSTSRVLRLALQYQDFDRFYFPHMLDFRGRAYPIPVGLQPQGDDLSRSLLMFAEGQPILSDRDAGWLAIQLASMWGWDKLPHDERITMVGQNEALWRRIAADPMGNLEWADKTVVDKPWQALAAIFDWVALLDHGFGYVSHLVCYVDGTCNGIQHLSAMTRDAVAGEHVNLIPGDRPRDIYKHVAKLLQAKLEAIEASGKGLVSGESSLAAQHATYWLDLTNRDLPRKLTKRQVMVLPYGGTKEAYIKYTRDWLDEASPRPRGESQEDGRLRFDRVLFLSTHMLDIVTKEVSGGVRVMEWLKACAKVASHGNQPIFWTTPTGFVVRHFYGKLKEKEVSLKLDGTQAWITLVETTKDLDVRSQLLGIAPNFTHSMDGAALQRCVTLCRKGDVNSFTSVHDAFGAHASSMDAMATYLRQAFVEVHSVDALAGFRNACLAVMVPELITRLGVDPFEAAQMADEKLPALLGRGTLDINCVLESDYFFA